MLKANLKIISLLKDFLVLVSNNVEYRNLFSFSPSDFSRKRKLPFESLVLFLLRLNKKTLSVELDNYFNELGQNIKCSVAAFSLQRLKLQPDFFYVWNLKLCDSFYDLYGKQVRRWKKYRVLACDGSSVSLVKRPALESHFGGQTNGQSSYVVAKTFYCYDSLNSLILHADIRPYRYSEFNMACDLIDSGKLQADMLLIFDRLYSGYNVVALFEYNENDVKYIIRVNENYNYTKQFLKSKKKSDIIELFPTYSSRKQLRKRGYIVRANAPIKVRLIKIMLPNNKIEVLMTNLLDEQKYETNEFKKLYALRWTVETNIDFQKNILQLESMSGLTPITVMQDFYTTVFATNLHFLLIKQAQETIDKNCIEKKYPMKVNNNKASGKIKETLIQLFINKKPIEILNELHDYFIRSPLPVRKNRSFQRLRKNPQSKSKHRTFSNYKPAC